MGFDVKDHKIVMWGKKRIRPFTLYRCACDECGADCGYRFIGRKVKVTRCKRCVARFAGQHSRNRLESEKITLRCAGCGIEVRKYRSQVIREDRVFCNLLCRNSNYGKAVPSWHPKNYKESHFTCQYCGIDFIVKGGVLPKNGRKFCSRVCSDIGHVRSGGHTIEGRKKLSDKQRLHCQNFGNQFVTGRSKGQHSEATKCRISRKNSGREPQWRGRTFIYSGPQGIMKLRSSYELFYAHWLDQNHIKWQYEPQFKLSDGKTFSPDFRLGTGVIIEVKGYFSEKGRKKWTLFCRDYPLINKMILFKNDLIKLGMKEIQDGD